MGLLVNCQRTSGGAFGAWATEEVGAYVAVLLAARADALRAFVVQARLPVRVRTLAVRHPSPPQILLVLLAIDVHALLYRRPAAIQRAARRAAPSRACVQHSGR